MPSSDFNPIRFGDLLVEPLRNGVYKSKEHHGRGVKVVNMGELFGHSRLRDVPMKRLELTDVEMRKSALRQGDLLFARRSLVAEGAGKCSIVKQVSEPTTFESSIIRARPDPRKVDSDYLYYYFASPQGRELMRTILRQVAVSGIAGSDLAELRVPIPCIETQRDSARVLEQLDDRIDLLRQTNTTLESVAQALFKSWFIDFDPVRAKAEGREPEGMDAATAALFPAEFEESAMGLIPKGCRVGTFGDMATLAKSTLNPLDSPSTVFEHYSLPAFDAGQLPVLETGDAIKSNKTRVPPGAVLQSKLNPHIPRVWFPSRVGEQAVCSTEFLPWLAKDTASPELVYCVLTSATFESEVRTLVTGTSNSHQRVKADLVAGLGVVIAPAKVYQAFTDAVRPLLLRVGESKWEAKSLAELRDTLLPRLISGKLRLPEAQEQLEDALA